MISNVLKHNCSDSDRWYVETMASSWVQSELIRVYKNTNTLFYYNEYIAKQFNKCTFTHDIGYILFIVGKIT